MHKVMIVGAGGIAPSHIEGFLAFPQRAEIKVIANPTVSKAEALVEKYSLNARSESSLKTSLSAVDIVSVCSPPATHKDIAVQALTAGKHVLLEKPMAMSLAECDAILDAAKTGGGKLSIVAQSRYISSIINTMEIIHRGEYGKLLFSQINSFWWRGQSYYDLYWRGIWESEGGGCTLNHAVHHIDLLLWAKGLPVEVTTIQTNLNHNNSEEEDLSMSILKYADNTLAQINTSLVHHGEEQKLDFQMEKAGISIPFAAKASLPRSNGFPVDDSATVNKVIADFESLPKLEHEHHTGQIENFLDAIDSGSPLRVDGLDGRHTIELISAIYKSAFTKKTVALPLKMDDPYYSFPSRIEQAVRYNTKTKFVDSFDDSTITSFKDKF
jgi:UDP-N-acetyl-2-amino-2-deoxyglucuronate dehydrogenase